jgi:hypothetical protein
LIGNVLWEKEKNACHREDAEFPGQAQSIVLLCAKIPSQSWLMPEVEAKGEVNMY